MARPLLSDEMESLTGTKLGWDLFLRNTYAEGAILQKPKCLEISECYSRICKCAPFLEARFFKGGKMQYEASWPNLNNLIRYARSEGVPNFELAAYESFSRRAVVIPPATNKSSSNLLIDFQRQAEGQEVPCCCDGCKETTLLDHMFFAVALVHKAAGSNSGIRGQSPDIIWSPPCKTCLSKGLLPSKLTGSFADTRLQDLYKFFPREHLQPLLKKLLLAFNTMQEHALIVQNPHKLNHLQTLAGAKETSSLQFDLGRYPGPLENLCAIGTNVLAMPRPINSNILKLLLGIRRLVDDNQPLANCSKLPKSLYKEDSAITSVFTTATEMHALDIQVVKSGSYLCLSKHLKTATEIKNVYHANKGLFSFECHCCPEQSGVSLLDEFLVSNNNPPCLIPQKMQGLLFTFDEWLHLRNTSCETIQNFFTTKVSKSTTSVCVAFSEELSGEDFLLIMHMAIRRNISLIFWGFFRLNPGRQITGCASIRPFLFFVWYLNTQIQFNFNDYKKMIAKSKEPSGHIALSGRENALQLGQAVFDTKGMAPFNILWFPWCTSPSDFVDYLTIVMANFSSSSWSCLLSIVFDDAKELDLSSSTVKRIADTADGYKFRLKISKKKRGLLFCKQSGCNAKRIDTIAATFANSKGLEMTIAIPKSGLELCKDLTTAFLRQRVTCKKSWVLPNFSSQNLLWGPTKKTDEVARLDMHNATVTDIESENPRITILAYAFYCCLIPEYRIHNIYQAFLSHAFDDQNHPFTNACHERMTTGLNIVLSTFFSALQEHTCSCDIGDLADINLGWYKQIFSAKPTEMLHNLCTTWLKLLQRAIRASGKAKFIVRYAIDRLEGRMPTYPPAKRRRKTTKH